MHHRNLVKNTSGVAIIEFALILPVLLLILLGVVEFGMYFMKEQVVQRTVSTTAGAIQLDPDNEMNKDNAYGSGAGLVDYTVLGNYICAKSYTKSADAKAGLCEASDWATTAPTTSDYIAGTPYFVAVIAYVQENSFTDLFKNYIPAIKVSSVFKVGGGGTAANTAGIGSVGGGCYGYPSTNGSQRLVITTSCWGNASYPTGFSGTGTNSAICPSGYTPQFTSQRTYVSGDAGSGGYVPQSFFCVHN